MGQASGQRNQRPLKVAVVGVGRMGRHHARTYSRLPQAQLLAVVDTNAERGGDVAEDTGCAACASVDELLARHPDLDAVTVAVPTVAHRIVAAPLLKRGIACLIEKPLAATVDDAAALAHLAEESHALLQVGHTERFNPAVRQVLGMDITARFIEVHRVSPLTFRSLDVGVVMDMMIHDLDIVLTLAGCPLRQVDATGVCVIGEHEDVAHARLVFETGCVANLTASRLALKTERKMRIFSESAYVSMDYQKRDGLVIRKSDNAAALAEARRELASGSDLSQIDYSKLVHVHQLMMNGEGGLHADDVEQDPLTAELGSFLDAVRDGRRPVVDARAGCAAVEAAHRVLESIRTHRWEGLAQPAV